MNRHCRDRDAGPGTHRRVHPRRRSNQRVQEGSASVWALPLTAGAFTVLLGLIVDGGRVVDDRLAAAHTAAQAARAGADALSQASVRNGSDDVAAAAATSRAQDYLRHTGQRGAVQVAGDTVSVTITGRSPTRILNTIGIEAFPVRETQTARAVTEEQP